jgi:hypothetical protein
MATGLYKEIIFGRYEQGPQAFHRAIGTALAAPL